MLLLFVRIVYTVASTNCNVTIRPSEARGRADFGWLDSRHSFSFDEYHDPAHMGFRSLRVINEDRVAPGGGFPTHPHRDMEIFSYVVSGALAHKDSMGNSRTLSPGEIQLMSAGSGVQHSEFNPSQANAAHFLQIWIKPSRSALTPSYTEWKPDAAKERDPLVLVISPDGRENSAVIHQDAFIHRLRLGSGESVGYNLRAGRGIWLQVITGALTFNGTPLGSGDGASTESAGTLDFSASAETEALLFDLA